LSPRAPHLPPTGRRWWWWWWWCSEEEEEEEVRATLGNTVDDVGENGYTTEEERDKTRTRRNDGNSLGGGILPRDNTAKRGRT